MLRYLNYYADRVDNDIRSESKGPNLTLQQEQAPATSEIGTSEE